MPGSTSSLISSPSPCFPFFLRPLGFERFEAGSAPEVGDIDSDAGGDVTVRARATEPSFVEDLVVHSGGVGVADER